VVILLVAAVPGTSAPSAPTINPLFTEQLPVGRSYNSIVLMTAGVYALGGERSTGSESWEVEPSIAISGSTAGENTYYVDGISVSDIEQGTVASMELIEEVSVKTGGYVAEYGAVMGGILDYQHGGTGVVTMVTKSGTNEFSGDRFAFTDASLNDLDYDQGGTLWGAGMSFEASGPAPVLGFFEEDGTFVPVETPLGNAGGYFQGLDFSDIGIAYGRNMQDDGPAAPLMAMSYDAGRTWGLPPMLPWEHGTINEALYVDPYAWVAGETPSGAAFAYTEDGGTTWTQQTMPDATYIWDMEVARIDPSTCRDGRSWFLGAALGTRYLDDGSKESIVYRTLDGQTWEELWRVPGHGGAIDFDAFGSGTVAMVQNHPNGATFSQYAAHDFFGFENLICTAEIIPSSNTATVNDPFTMHLQVRGPWGGLIPVETVLWTTDAGDLVVDTGDPFQAALTVFEPLEATVTCSLPDFDLSTAEVITVEPYGD